MGETLCSQAGWGEFSVISEKNNLPSPLPPQKDTFILAAMLSQEVADMQE